MTDNTLTVLLAGVKVSEELVMNRLVSASMGDVPKFDGTAASWVAFRNAFLSTARDVHRLIPKYLDHSEEYTPSDPAVLDIIDYATLSLIRKFVYRTVLVSIENKTRGELYPGRLVFRKLNSLYGTLKPFQQLLLVRDFVRLPNQPTFDDAIQGLQNLLTALDFHDKSLAEKCDLYVSIILMLQCDNPDLDRTLVPPGQKLVWGVNTFLHETRNLKQEVCADVDLLTATPPTAYQSDARKAGTKRPRGNVSCSHCGDSYHNIERC